MTTRRTSDNPSFPPAYPGNHGAVRNGFAAPLEAPSVSGGLAAVDVEGLAGDERARSRYRIPSTTSRTVPMRPSGWILASAAYCSHGSSAFR